MTVTLLAVGRLRPSFRAACDDYGRRLRRYLRFEEVEVRESRAAGVAARRVEEGRRLADRFPASGTVVALTREGTMRSSAELARRLARWREAARPVAIVIGGPDGLGPGVLDAAAERWSLGPLTLPHELARVVAIEQLYRSCTILRGEPYHRGADA